ncbi:MAG: FAD-dependent oxidoreductase [Elusimicrobia bacterium]|nr:FAD-dependent oxidoreductase [Elusimicrobiota bacterium]
MARAKSPGVYDVIVVGGGVTGAGVARDCAMRGLKTLLLERGRPGAATTLSSSHLIHGGLRYLLYDRLTTHMTCWDSGHIVRIARPLLAQLPIVWPVYRGHAHGIETVETLLEAYDAFQPMKEGRPHLRLSAAETLRLFPGLSPEGLLGAVSFDEWWVDPLALVRDNLASARRHGAEIRADCAVTNLARAEDIVTGVLCGEEWIESRLVINAAGPWIDKVAGMAGLSIPLRLQKGTHLVYRKKLTPAGLLLEAADKVRYVFMIPSAQGTLVGPTDIAAPHDPDQVSTAPSEIKYLLDSLKRYFPRFPESYDETIVGARPILGQGGSEKLLSREFEVFDHERRDGLAGLLTIGGGKMSDFRLMAETVTDAACEKLGVAAGCRTQLETLSGEALGHVPAYPKPPKWLRRLLRRHPRLREFHAIAHLGATFAAHMARRPFSPPLADAERFRDHYCEP